MKKYNLLYVFSDQHRWCDVGCYGNKGIETPYLDAFSINSVQFQHCISNSPVCVPARGSMLTGNLPMKHGAITNDLAIRNDVISVADVLNKAGYHTGYIGKWHLAGVPRDAYIPMEARLGFKEWKAYNCAHQYEQGYYYNEENERIEVEGYEPMVQTDLAIDFIERNNDQPWGLYLSWGPPHDPYFEVPEEYVDIYKDRAITLRENVGEDALDSLERTLTRDEIIHNHIGYYAHITALDRQFGRLIESLERTGQLENTIIVYTSDHGDMLGSQGFTNKQLPYEEAIKVPLLISNKDLIKPRITKALIGLVDLPVSLLGLMGLEYPEAVDGCDLSELLANDTGKGLEEVYIFDLIACHQAIWRGSREWRGIRTSQYTFAKSSVDDGFVLFNNEVDPYQLENLVVDQRYLEVKKDLNQRLSKLIKKNDQLLPWEDFIRHYDLTDEWNESQAYFDLPLL